MVKINHIFTNYHWGSTLFLFLTIVDFGCLRLNTPCRMCKSVNIFNFRCTTLQSETTAKFCSESLVLHTQSPQLSKRKCFSDEQRLALKFYKWRMQINYKLSSLPMLNVCSSTLQLLQKQTLRPDSDIFLLNSLNLHVCINYTEKRKEASM